jgi:hypothetical protein
MFKAFTYLLTTAFMLVVFFGAVAPSISNLFGLISNNGAVQSSSVVGPGILDSLATFLFVLAPLILGFGAIVIGFVFAVRLRGTSGVNR